MDLILTHDRGNRVTLTMKDGDAKEEARLFRPALRQPLLTAALGFPLLGLFADTGLFVISPPLQFPEEPFPRKLFLGDFERFLDVVVEDFDFHSSLVCTFPGDACKDFFSVQPGGGV